MFNLWTKLKTKVMACRKVVRVDGGSPNVRALIPETGVCSPVIVDSGKC